MPAEKLRILLVEDNPGDRDLVRIYLAESFERPVELLCVDTLAAARDVVDPHRLDLVLLDLGLPDASGLDAVGKMRRMVADVPIVVLTGGDDAESGVEALARDAQDYLMKDDLDGKTLSRSVRYALHRRRWQQQYRHQLGVSPDGMLIVDGDGVVQFANTAAEEMLGGVPDAIEGLPSAVRLARAAPMDVTLETGRIVEARSVGTEWLGTAATLISLRDMTERRDAERALTRLTEELRKTNAQLEALVSSDPLTDVLNRRGMEDALGRELDRVQRSGDQLIGVLVDFDDFKTVNDRYGHAVGDAALKALAGSIQDALRGGDQLGRVGGDEFLVILSDLTVAEGMAVAEKLRRTVRSTTLPVADGSLTLSASFAVGVLDPTIMSIEQVVGSLGGALKRSKRSGKDRVSIIAETADAHDWRDGDLDADGIELQIAFQTIRRTDGQEIVGNEALTRGPPGAFEQPNDLFRAAFEQDVLTTLDLRAFTKSLDVLKAVAAQGVQHVNLFPSTLLNTPIDRIIRLLCERTDPHRLCIELSEQQFLGDPTYLREPLGALQRAGVRVAIDDVGFGRSSIEALLVLEPDVVKVDRHCVQGIERQMGERRQLERLIEMLAAVGAAVIVEGVESEGELGVLQDIGVKFAQGFLWGEPVRAL